jgi:hypothetical protein
MAQHGFGFYRGLAIRRPPRSVASAAAIPPITDTTAQGQRVPLWAINGHQFGLDGEDSRTLHAVGDKFGDGLYHAPRLSFQANAIAGISAQAS